MKKMQYLVVLAIAAIAATSCQKETTNSTDSAPDSRSLVFSAEKPSLDGSRTHFEGNRILWDAAGERARFAYATYNSTDDKWEINGNPFNTTDDATVSADGMTATFTYKKGTDETLPTAEGRYRFHSLYPASAYAMWEEEKGYGSVHGNVNPEDVLTRISVPQYPTDSSYDPNADLVVGFSKEEYASLDIAASIPMEYKRLVTHGNITLGGLGASWQNGDKINRIVFTVPEYDNEGNANILGGLFYLNLFTMGTASEDAKSPLNYIYLDYTAHNYAPRADGKFDAWFCTLPFELGNGEYLQTEIMTDKGIYTRKVVVNNTTGIAFPQNRCSKLEIDMSRGSFSPYTMETDKSELTLPATLTGEEQIQLRINSAIAYKEFLQGVVEDYTPDVTVESDAQWLNPSIDWWNPVSESDGISIYKVTFYTDGDYHGKEDRTARVIIKNNLTGDTATVAVTQQRSTGDVEIDGELYNSIVVAGLRWYPFNCGYDKTHFRGLQYQWGRKVGQWYYYKKGSDTYYNEGNEPYKSVRINVVGENRTPKADVADYVYDNKLLYPADDTVYDGYVCTAYTVDGGWYAEFDSDGLAKAAHLPDGWQELSTKVGSPCPDGWRIPTKADMEKLVAGCDFEDWGSDTFYCVDKQTGVKLALPKAGYNLTLNGYASSGGRGYTGTYWTSTADPEDGHKAYAFNYSKYRNSDATMNVESLPHYYGYSVRCVKDAQ